MRDADITLRITRLTMVELHALGANVLAKLRGNAHFPAPPTSLADLESLMLRFRDLVSEATYGGKQALEQRNACAAEVRDTLTSLACYVRSRSARNAAMLATSGFPMRKTPEPIGPLPAPAVIAARMGRASGSITVRWQKVRGAYLYQLFMAPLGSDQWQKGPTVKRVSHTFHALETDRRYQFKVMALGTAGMGPESGVAQAMAA